MIWKKARSRARGPSDHPHLYLRWWQTAALTSEWTPPPWGLGGWWGGWKGTLRVSRLCHGSMCAYFMGGNDRKQWNQRGLAQGVRIRDWAFPDCDLGHNAWFLSLHFLASTMTTRSLLAVWACRIRRVDIRGKYFINWWEVRALEIFVFVFMVSGQRNNSVHTPAVIGLVLNNSILGVKSMFF